MKTLKRLKYFTIFSLVLLLALFSCQSGQQKSSQVPDDTSDEHMEEKQTVKIASKEYPIPTSFEITQMINNAGASYIYDLSNSVENVDKYFTEKEKALNLGIYGADLSYASTYQKKQETMQFLDASKKLIDDLNITSFNKELAEAVEKNIDNKDTLISLITDSFYDTYQFLLDNGKDDLSIFVLTGSWIEGLYIATQLTMNAQDKTEFKEVILSQRESLYELLKIMERNKDNEDIASLIKTLESLKSAFDSFHTDMTDEQLQTVISRVETIRNEMI